MAFLSAVIGVRDSSGVRVDSPDALGNYLPIVLKLGSNLTSSVTQSGGVSVVTIAAAGGGSVTSVTGTTPINSSGGATPDITIDAASGTGPGYMSPAHFSLVDGATSAATASTLAKRDADGRMKAVAGVASDDVAVVSQLGGGLTTALDLDYTAETPVDIQAGGDGTYTIGGVDHVAVNMANASSLAVGADGLKGAATNAGANFPQLHALLSELAPTVSLAKHEVWIVWRIVRSGVFQQDVCQLRLAIDYETWAGGDAATRYVCGQHDIQLATGRRWVAQTVGFAVGSFTITAQTDDEMFALRLSDGGRTVQGYGLTWPGSWPDIGDLECRYSAQLDITGSTPADVWSPKNATVRMRWDNTGNTSNVFAIPRLQVLYR